MTELARRCRALMGAKKDSLVMLKQGTYHWLYDGVEYWTTSVDNTGLATITTLIKPAVASGRQGSAPDLTKTIELKAGDSIKVFFRHPTIKTKTAILGNVFWYAKFNDSTGTAFITNQRLYYNFEYDYTLTDDISVSALCFTVTNGYIDADKTADYWVEFYVNDVLVIGRK